MPESERGRARLSLSSSRLHDDDDWRSWVGVTNEAQKVAHTHVHAHTRGYRCDIQQLHTHTHSFSFTLSLPLSLCALVLSACWQYWKRARESKWQALRYRRDTWGHFGTSVSDKTSSGFHASSSTLCVTAETAKQKSENRKQKIHCERVTRQTSEQYINVIFLFFFNRNNNNSNRS